MLITLIVFLARKFIAYKQPGVTDCGPTCLRMIAKYYGKNVSLDVLKRFSGFEKEGVSMFGITEAAEYIGLTAVGVRLTFEELTRETVLPAILHWNLCHFVVLPPQKFNKKTLVIADPSTSILEVDVAKFKKNWLQMFGDVERTGAAILFNPNPMFHKTKID